MPDLRELPVHPPESFDNSMLSTFQRCPRKAFYHYYLNRAPDGINYPIQFGLGYHKYREILERIYIQKVVNGSEELTQNSAEAWHEIAFATALKVHDFTDPPLDHRKSYLDTERLRESCDLALERWMREKAQGKIHVLFTEQPVAVPLPDIDEEYTGKMDQIVEWNGELWVRDFKTTSRMGKNYSDQFDPNNQMTGYVWMAEQLSGRRVKGVMIEVVYNTKRNGPEFHPFLSTRSPQAIEDWLEEVQYEIETARRYEKDDRYPKRTTACRDYGGCFFRGACQKANWRTRENWLRSKTIRSVWDPLNPEEEEGITD